VLRAFILGIADNPLVKRIATSGIGRAVALRFVAGEDLSQALDVIRKLNAAGSTVSIDHLGENVTDLDQAKAATEVTLRALDAIEAESLKANVSIKLTQLGLDVDREAALANVEQIVARAATARTTVTLDMEDHRYTDRTIDTCVALAAEHPGVIGTVVQAYLHRTPEDLDRLIEARVHVRLCKGAYKEPRAIAYASKADVDAAYARLAVRLLSSESYAMIATHDERLVRHAMRQAHALQRPRDTFEFQMLYGVRRELQRELVAEDFSVRVYVPFGTQWYPYLMRRVAERPANIRFFLEALFRG
jgi:proline dehydrogenase